MKRLWKEYYKALEAARLPPEPEFQEILDNAAKEAEWEKSCRNGEERGFVSTRWRAEADCPHHPYNKRQAAMVEARTKLAESLLRDELAHLRAAADEYISQLERALVAAQFAPKLLTSLSVLYTSIPCVQFSPGVELKEAAKVTQVRLIDV